MLGRALLADGHAVRASSRRAEALEACAADGLEPWEGDPSRIATLTQALDAVTVLCWLLGAARGTADEVAALHTTRLARMLEETVDTTVRGVVYEAPADGAGDLRARGEAVVADAAARWAIPTAVLDHDPADADGWVAAARTEVGRLLGIVRSPAVGFP